MLFRKAKEYGLRSTEVYEMNLGGRWYYINSRNVVVHGSPELTRNLFNAALQGLICHVKGKYLRNEKKLVLHLEEAA